MWTQNYNPAGNMGLSALIAGVPVLFLAWALGIRKMKGYAACLLTLIISILIAVLFYKTPVQLSLLAMMSGMLYGLFPIGWLIVAALFLYNLTVKSGRFEIIKDSIALITADRRLQALLIGFSFGALQEAAAGFGAPVAITGAMLVGLGFNPLHAAAFCLVANTTPVPFGSIGIPVFVAGQVAGIDAVTLGKMVGRQLPFLSFLLPAFLVAIMSGFKGLLGVLPAVLVAGVSFALGQWFASDYLGPMLPGIISATLSIACLVAFLKIWKPKSVWRFPGETTSTVKQHPPGIVLKAWSPFIFLTVLVGTWGLKQVQDVLNLVTVKFPVPGLHGAIRVPGAPAPMDAVFTFNWLSVPATAIVFAAILTAFAFGISAREFCRTFRETLAGLKYALITISSVLGFAYVANYSGISRTLGLALTCTGFAYPFLSAFIGWVGVFITGSNTSSNALFGKLQVIAATRLGIDPVLTVAANVSGGVAGKIISPQSIAVASGSVGLTGREGELFRSTIFYSLGFAAFIGAIAYLQAYHLRWMIPPYRAAETVASGAGIGPGPGLAILSTVSVVLFLLAFILSWKCEKRSAKFYSGGY